MVHEGNEAATRKNGTMRKITVKLALEGKKTRESGKLVQGKVEQRKSRSTRKVEVWKSQMWNKEKW